LIKYVLPEKGRAKPLKKSTLNNKKEVGMGRRRDAEKLCASMRSRTRHPLYDIP